MMFSKGDIVEIIGCECGHEFSMGEKCEIVRYSSDISFAAKSLSSGVFWQCCSDEVRLIEPSTLRGKPACDGITDYTNCKGCGVKEGYRHEDDCPLLVAAINNVTPPNLTTEEMHDFEGEAYHKQTQMDHEQAAVTKLLTPPNEHPWLLTMAPLPGEK